jgi:hypothetical protein
VSTFKASMKLIVKNTGRRGREEAPVPAGGAAGAEAPAAKKPRKAKAQVKAQAQAQPRAAKVPHRAGAGAAARVAAPAPALAIVRQAPAAPAPAGAPPAAAPGAAAPAPMPSPFCMICRDRSGRSPACIIFACGHMNTCAECFERDQDSRMTLLCSTCEEYVDVQHTRVIDPRRMRCVGARCVAPKSAVFGSCGCFKYCHAHALELEGMGVPCPGCNVPMAGVRRVVYPTI